MRMAFNEYERRYLQYVLNAQDFGAINEQIDWYFDYAKDDCRIYELNSGVDVKEVMNFYEETTKKIEKALAIRDFSIKDGMKIKAILCDMGADYVALKNRWERTRQPETFAPNGIKSFRPLHELLEKWKVTNGWSVDCLTNRLCTANLSELKDVKGRKSYVNELVWRLHKENVFKNSDNWYKAVCLSLRRGNVDGTRSAHRDFQNELYETISKMKK